MIHWWTPNGTWIYRIWLSDTPTTSTTATTVPTAVTSPVPTVLVSGSIEELTKQISKLTLFLEGQPRQQPRGPGPAPASNFDRPWQRSYI